MFYAGVIVSASVNMLEYAEVRLMDISTLEGQVEALVEKALKWTNYTCSPLAGFEEQEWLLALSACICLSPQPSVIPIWQHDVTLYSLCGASPYVTEKTWRTGCGILRWCLIRVRSVTPCSSPETKIQKQVSTNPQFFKWSTNWTHLQLRSVVLFSIANYHPYKTVSESFPPFF